MAGFTSALRRFYVPTVAVLLLLIPVALYLLGYVPAREAYFASRNFRLLAAISDQTQAKVANFGEILRHAADESELSAADYVRNFVPGLRIVSETPARPAAAASGTATMDVRQEGDVTWLYFDYAGRKREVHAKTDLPDVLAPFLTRRLFDDVLVADKSGRILFRQPQSELRLNTVTTLLDDKGVRIPFDSLSQSSSLADVSLAGARYKLFLQPIRLPFHRLDEKGRPESIDWVLCGLVRSNRFRSETQAISYTTITWFLFLLFLALLSWPFLKLAFMSPRERLRATDGFFLAVSTLLGASLLTLLLLDTYYDRVLQTRADDQLKQLARQIDENFYREVSRASAQLDDLANRREFLEAVRDLAARERTSPADASPGLVKGKQNILRAGWERGGDFYPYLDYAFWFDQKGRQRVKWTVRSRLTPFINVSNRPYYPEIKNDRLWNVRPPVGPVMRFLVEPIQTVTTGERLGILCTPAAARSGVNDQLVAGCLVGSLLSLIEPVVPPGFGYRVIDRAGQVLFHSGEMESIRENFFTECDNNRRLESAVYGRGGALLSATYLGRGHRLYVTPFRTLPDLPWTLVVHRDMMSMRTMNLEALTISAILFLAYGVILLLPFLLAYAVRPAALARWMWPNLERRADYGVLILGFLGLIVLLAAWISASADLTILYGCFLWPALAIALTLFILRPRRKSPSDAVPAPAAKAGWPPCHTGYTIAAFLLLVLIGVLPCVGFFKIAYEYEAKLLVKYGQFQLAAALEDRAERIRMRYRDVELPPGEKEDFIARRRAESLDTYHSAFFKTTSVPPALVSLPPDIETGVSTLTALLGGITLPYNEIAVRSRGLIHDVSPDRSWVWNTGSGEQGPLLRLHHLGAAGQTVLESELPTLRALQHPLAWIAVGPLLLGVFLGMRATARRMFLFELADLARLRKVSLAPSELSAGNLLVLGGLFSGKSECLKNRSDVHLVDLRAETEKQEWARSFPYGSLPAGKAIVVDQFEHRFDDPVLDRDRLYFVEHLVAAAKTSVVILSSVDPIYYFSSSAAPIQPESAQPEKPEQKSTDPALRRKTVDAWAIALNSFTTVLFENPDRREAEFDKAVGAFQAKISLRLGGRAGKALAALLREECRPTRYLRLIGVRIAEELGQRDTLTEHQLRAEILDRAGVYYRGLWASCSREEKLVLVQLAQGGLVNPKSHADIRQLVRKNLLLRDPGFHIMNDTFRRFVLSEARPDEVIDWEREEGQSGWGKWSTVLPTILVGVVAFLYLTQREVFQSSMAFLSAVVAAIPAVLKLSDFFTGPRPTSAGK